MQHYSTADNGETLVNELMEGEAIAVCDGSYKSGKGAAAWMIEGNSATGRIKGWNWVPGGVFNQSSYRSELAGLLGIVSFTVELCTYHKTPKATITIACDNILALQTPLIPILLQ